MLTSKERADLRAQAAGAYEFGRIDPAKFTGKMTFVPVNTTQGFWQFNSESFAVNGGAPQAGTKGAQAIADTGTTLILADPKAVQAYYSQVEGAQNDAQAGGITFPCNSKLPDLQLDVGGTMATVAGKFINFAQVDATSESPFFSFSLESMLTCYQQTASVVSRPALPTCSSTVIYSSRATLSLSTVVTTRWASPSTSKQTGGD